MIRFSITALFFVALQYVLIACTVRQQLPGTAYEQGSTDTLTNDGFRLIFIQQDPDFDPRVASRLKETFFAVYPVLVATFNLAAVHEVTLTVDTTYKGVAYAHDGRVVISQEWLDKNPADVDVVTHEVMHIVQAYPAGSEPGWLVEGIADYARHKYGVDNAGAGWSLPDLKDEHHYTDSYRVSARFLHWIERVRKPGFVKTLDRAMRTHTYKEDIWQAETGLDLSGLWTTYIRDCR